MFRKSVSILALVVFAFFVFGAAPAAGQPPTQSWEKVFTAPLDGDSTVVWALEAFDNNLYTAVARFPTGVQVYSSPDGSNWKAVSEPGFGIDPRLYVSWDMFVYKGQLYMGAHDLASHEVPGRIMRSRNGKIWETVFVVDEPGFLVDRMPAMFGEFNGMLYVAILSFDWDADSEIWRSPSGDAGTWEKVFSVKNGGFGAALTSFKGYAYISGWDSEAGTAWVWRTPDGLRWEKVGVGVLDAQGNYSDDTIRQFRNHLYVSTHNIYGARIYRSDDGVEWEEVVNDGFGEETLFTEMNGLMPFQGDLYAFVTAYGENGISYARVYRSHTGNPQDWQPVLTDWGPYSGTNREEQAIFKGNLYAADFNFNNSPAVFRLSGK